MLIVTGTIHLSPADLTAFLGDMTTFSSAARAHDGCLFFAVAPGDLQAGRLLVIERWRDQAALSAHLAAPDTKAFVAQWQERMRADLTKFDATNPRALMAP
jgi:quinol monooxygenase YgiN